MQVELSCHLAIEKTNPKYIKILRVVSVFNKFLIGPKENLYEEDNLSTRGKMALP